MIVFDTATLKAPLVAILRNAAARTMFAVVPRQQEDLLLRTTTPVSPWTESKISIVTSSFAAELATENLDLSFEKSDAGIAAGGIGLDDELWKDVEPAEHSFCPSIEVHQERNNEGLSTFWNRSQTDAP